LRDKEKGCPWDRQQDFSTIAPYTIEEAYEVADAIQRENLPDLRDELGDLLLQVVFHAQLGSELSEFNFADVVNSICEKMIRRHPHVFAGQAVESAENQSLAWEDGKERERQHQGETSLMDGIPRGMAELQRANKLQKRAARCGFDWQSTGPVFEKLDEETAELLEAIQTGEPERVEDELGDLLFVVTNLARKLKIDPAKALRSANAKFEHRFRALEVAVGDRTTLDEMDLEAMERMWQQVKAESHKRAANE
jgi:ATP diphosphatase